MPFDAVFLRAVTTELQEAAVGAKVDKIYLPSRDTAVLQLRTREANRRLLLCASPNSPRVHFTAESFENPATPPMFCMLLRKHLVGGRIAAITQPPMERSLELELDCTDEMGEAVKKRLIIEIMGRNSNLILCGPDGRIIDCLRRVDYEMSEKRQVLPGLFYHQPPRQEKLDPLEADRDRLLSLLEGQTAQKRAADWLMDTFLGLSPLLCREQAVALLGDQDADLSVLDDAARAAFADGLLAFFDTIRAGDFTPVMLLKGDKPSDFTFRPITQYGSYMTCRTYDNFSLLLDDYYAERDKAERIRQKSQAITKSVTNLRNRTARKLQNQRKELDAAADRERQRQLGDIVTANLHAITRGQPVLRAVDFYDPEMREIDIPLSPLLSPQQNAAKFYKDYQKLKNAEKYLTEQIAKGEVELDYLGSILDALSRAESERDIQEIRQELVEGGYIREKTKQKKMKQAASRPLEFVSSTGWPIYVGRNNRQNDLLTTKTALKYDLWLHTQKIHGSHVIVACSGSEPDDQTVTEAATLAAYYSQARDGENVPVDYTPVKYVKKPNGAKPGMVIYTTYRTAYVTPDKALVEKLRKK
jgi:predicted ribosome quality control (RQC) complex YloA/Tae2 family protein